MKKIVIISFLISATAVFHITQQSLLQAYNEKAQSSRILTSRSMLVVRRTLRKTDPAVYSRHYVSRHSICLE